MSGDVEKWAEAAAAVMWATTPPDSDIELLLFAVRAFLATAKADGVVFTRVHNEMGSPVLHPHDEWAKGWNAAIAAVLAGKVTI